MAGQGVSTPAVFAAGAGALFLWSGLGGKSVTGNLRSLLSANPHLSKTTANPITGSAAAGSTAPGDTGAHSGSAAMAQALAQSMAVASGHPDWAVGQQWQDWVSLWNRESGWNNLAMNPSSGAFGIAQALGHGTAGSGGKYGNQYPSVAANDGDMGSQIAWGIGYIRDRYGSPSAAWAHETSAGWY